MLDTSGRAIVATNNFILNTVVSIEFLFKPAREFDGSQIICRTDGAFNIKFGYPFIQFITTTTTTNDIFKVNLEGVGRASYGYYTDGNWHHMVFKYNVTTGIKQIWVDGQLPDGFADTTATGTFNTRNASVNINSNTINAKYFGNIDEIALYDQDLPANNIYKHYTDFIQHKHYTYTNSIIIPPAASPVTAFR